nr:uncharacterized protein LOC112730092 [Arachis hypogaea]
MELTKKNWQRNWWAEPDGQRNRNWTQRDGGGVVVVVATRRRWEAAQRRSLVEAGRRFGGWGRKRVMEGRREEGGEAGEGCEGRGGRQVWVRWCGGGSVMGRWGNRGRSVGGKKRKRRREGRGGLARKVRWQGRGEVGWGGWSVVVVTEGKREWRGEGGKY